MTKVYSYYKRNLHSCQVLNVIPAIIFELVTATEMVLFKKI